MLKTSWEKMPNGGKQTCEAYERANKHVIKQKEGVLGGQMQVWIKCPQFHWIEVRTKYRLLHEHVGNHKKIQKINESQTGGTKQARQAYQHRMKQRKVCIKHTNTTRVYLTSGYTQSIPRRYGCNHTSISPWRAQSMAKPRSREANMEIKHRNKQANIDMQRKLSKPFNMGQGVWMQAQTTGSRSLRGPKHKKERYQGEKGLLKPMAQQPTQL